MNFYIAIVLIFYPFSILLSQNTDDDHLQAKTDVTLSILVEKADALSIFRTALLGSGWLKKLSEDEAEYTLFTPTDEAFERMDRNKFEALMSQADPEKLSELVESHIVIGKLSLEKLGSIDTIGLS
ncbi:MAG: fasciclin domain-containing protein [Cyclobacteriaceae bacterium]|nr:fasciclin domain-containing protein [Cyclobacteriaceae bacterium]MCH8517830.1 fasciclin domain-containing protein [Cyclobacteriaceae bacterium]